MGKSQREKGKRGERRVATGYRDAMPGADVKRGWQARTGKDAPDVDAGGIFWVESKFGKQPSPRAALLQAEADAAKGAIPVAHIKDDGKPAFVVLSESDWLDMVREWWRNR